MILRNLDRSIKLAGQKIRSFRFGLMKAAEITDETSIQEAAGAHLTNQPLRS